MSNKSLVDTLSAKLSPVIRNLTDIRIKKLLGIQTQILRIYTDNEDSLGNFDETIASTIIDDVTIKYPTGEIQLHINRDYDDKNIDMTSFDLWDILPIKLQVPFEADYDTEAVALQEGDIIIHIFYDEHDNPIPIIMQITKVLGTFRTRFLVKREYNLTLYRPDLTNEMQTELDNYLSTLTFP